MSLCEVHVGWGGSAPNWSHSRLEVMPLHLHSPYLVWDLNSLSVCNPFHPRERHDNRSPSPMPDSRICPSPGQYAMIQVDPVASVQHLNDKEASEAAATISTKSYLVLLGIVCSQHRPSPAADRHRFSVGSCTSSSRDVVVHVQRIS